MGLKRKEDLNEPDQEGVGYYAHTIKNGRRMSSSKAFLKPALHRKNLKVVTDAYMDRVLFDGKRVTGVACRVDGVATTFQTSGEVILSAGAIQSPKILQLSGIGPASYLQSIGVSVVSDSPDVGANLRDHLGFTIAYRMIGGLGINSRFYGLGLLKSLLQYYTTRSGALAGGPFEVGAFIRTQSHLSLPDAQLFLGAFTYRRNENNFPVPIANVEKQPGLTSYGQLLKLTSTGTIMIKSPDPMHDASIAPNWLTTEEDQRAAIAMVRYMRRYMTQPALKPYVGEELVPGPAIMSDDEILTTFRQRSTSGLHAVSTCRKGRDNAAVVDERLRVRGVEGLRVVDCSIMPGLISGNTNGPAMAVGWRASDIILEEQKESYAAA